jgi:hypothetical protein
MYLIIIYCIKNGVTTFSLELKGLNEVLNCNHFFGARAKFATKHLLMLIAREINLYPSCDRAEVGVRFFAILCVREVRR